MKMQSAKCCSRGRSGDHETVNEGGSRLRAAAPLEVLILSDSWGCAYQVRIIVMRVLLCLEQRGCRAISSTQQTAGIGVSFPEDRTLEPSGRRREGELGSDREHMDSKKGVVRSAVCSRINSGWIC